MTTAEKITAGIALLAALGVGAVLQAWVTYLLHGRERKINIADKSVQMAETLMTRMEAELTRVQEALAKAQQETEELRATLTETSTNEGSISEQLHDAERSLRGVNVQIINASTAIGGMQGQVHHINESGIENWAQRILAASDRETTAEMAALRNLIRLRRPLIPEQRSRKRDDPDDPEPQSQR
ncbi:hypothetical protein V1634_29105 [Plantactinospora veratri]|uniref:Uncharacterized protein n=1 Tax=Plantactinospora veratri TaxID=1436122 RepID=A0ABU7SLS3_9ACTN